jgi:hypothetical protein
VLHAGGEASSKRVIDNNDATCAMVSRCYVSGTSWTLKSVGKSPGGNPQLQLTYSTWKQEYDDISNRYNGTTSTMVYQVRGFLRCCWPADEAGVCQQVSSRRGLTSRLY